MNNLFNDAAASFVDNGVDRIANDLIPGNGQGFISGGLQTGADQYLNNQIDNRFFDGALDGNQGGYGGGQGGYGGSGGFF
ncbi:unnamed protein product [Didymodactylos carnosus]|uniref:Uncharacterized protein n=1 Tax=Didymodactylos carnosus TaxID=1234261 RepID=A0A814X4Z9_9BILA|nr:unnamed protein product [Didymodactylos carnosus]CAF3975046.1 unnamed protein product [Didymodactylos carnosus]